MRSTLVYRWSWFAWMLVFPIAAGADVAGSEAMLAQNANVMLTRADYETELARMVPADRRADFARSPQRITGLLNALLVRKTLAAEAREAGLDREPLPGGTDAGEDAILAQRVLAKLDADTRVDFDRRIEGFTAKARENYLVTKQAYITPEQIEVSRIFVEAAKRGDDSALHLAEKVRAELLNGAKFATLAQEYSDDRASRWKGGRANWISRNDLDPTLAKTVFAMQWIGEISEVIRTRTGYYIARLDGKRPARQQTFDEVKDLLLEQLRKAHVDARRAAKTDSILADADLRINQPAIDMLVNRIDPEAIRRALQALPADPSPN